MYQPLQPIGPSVATGGVLVSTGQPLVLVLSAAAIVGGCTVALMARAHWRRRFVEDDGPRYHRSSSE